MNSFKFIILTFCFILICCKNNSEEVNNNQQNEPKINGNENAKKGPDLQNSISLEIDSS
jgi:hypothetical protein